jgi:hypothetical protein
LAPIERAESLVVSHLRNNLVLRVILPSSMKIVTRPLYDMLRCVLEDVFHLGLYLFNLFVGLVIENVKNFRGFWFVFKLM